MRPSQGRDTGPIPVTRSTIKLFDFLEAISRAALRVAHRFVGQKSESLILEYLYDCARTYFIKNSWLKEVAPPPLANARRQAKYSLRFLICMRHQKILLKRKEYFAWLCSERTGGGNGLCFISLAGKKFPPPTPSTFCPLASNCLAKI